jgi:hypothetical protein
LRYAIPVNAVFQEIVRIVSGCCYICVKLKGDDRDLMTDGCALMLSINSTAAEPTGFIFDGTGEVAFYIVQHGQILTMMYQRFFCIGAWP